MPMNATELGDAVDRLIRQHRQEKPRLDTIAAWLSGRAHGLYVPNKVTTEFRSLVNQSRFNVLPLVVTTVAQSLYIDGYRPTSTRPGRSADGTNTGIWDTVWQANRMDSRQASIWRAAIKYGWSYTTVLPGPDGGPGPTITPYSPRSLTALYDDPVNDEWPTLAMTVRRPIVADTRDLSTLDEVPDVNNGAQLTVYDTEFAYKVTNANGKWVADPEATAHGLGVVPVVRFLDEQGNDDNPLVPSTGKIESLIPAQQQLNQISFSLAMALQYGAFRQRWVTGMAIQEDANGVPIEPFNVAVDKLLHAEDDRVKFGEFNQTDPSGYLNARDKVLGFIGSVAQIPPHNLIAGPAISNISAEALAALQYAHRNDIAEHQDSFGAGARQMFRLAGLAAGDQAAWADDSAWVHWGDTTPRSFGELVDGLGKLAAMLDVPPEALWDRIPDTTDAELEEWKRLAERRAQERMMQLTAFVDEQTPDPDPEALADANPGIVNGSTP